MCAAVDGITQDGKLVIIRPKNLLNLKKNYKTLSEACRSNKTLEFHWTREGFKLNKNLSIEISALFHVTGADRAIIVFLNQNDHNDVIMIECERSDYNFDLISLNKMEKFYNDSFLKTVIRLEREVAEW
uniref:(northern house mosquito) hypothetical protein n=1 Tax=Culex pipiens TaxID=7175 RepID=A0A8D8AZ33_CULPI